MKITGVKTTLYLHKLSRRMGDVNSPSGRVQGTNCVVELETDEGLTGIGLGGGGVRPQIHAMVDGLLNGQDPRRVYGLWQRMVGKHFKGGHDGLINDAISVLDMALWDLKARIAGEPLWKSLGGSRGKALCYASGIELPLSDQQVHDWYSRMAAEYGFKGGKLKVGLDQEADLRRLGLMDKALRQATERPMLMVDANEYWSPKQAIRKVRQMEEQFDLAWVEEPARRWDYEGLRLVSQQVRAAVATCENLRHISEVYPLVHHQAVDILNISAGQTGFTGCRQIAHLAHAYELPVSMMNCQANYMAHLAAALPNHLSMEVVDPGREHCLRFSHHLEDGFIVLGNEPGLGIEVDEAKLKALQANPPARKGNFPFPRRQGAGLYVKAPEPGEVPWR